MKKWVISVHSAYLVEKFTFGRPDYQFPRSLAKSVAQLNPAVTQCDMVLFQNPGIGFNLNITIQLLLLQEKTVFLQH